MIQEVFAEFLGTFVFLSAILAAAQPIPIAVGLLAVIYIFGSISGGHFNPAVSVMMFVKGTVTLETCIMYVISQVLGGIVALLTYNALRN